MPNTKLDEVAIGERIKKIRLQLGFTMEDFGSLIDNASKGNVSNWERGVNIPRYERIRKIALLGGVSPNMVLYGQEKLPLSEDILDKIKNIDLFDFLEINEEVFFKGKKLSQSCKRKIILTLENFIEKKAN
ncbi:helix-turn-helix domain-containing protein [Lysinibacillus sp. OL1]|uniref:helix-turn-helix domain-containing protein n=1 Tax=Lysinibacillus sp. OL1 TaxID=2517243 RepID=UPI001D1152E2|nr:helix-turn-helix transcriptional regulator [Lysinibacillus sp. OL1]